jgi:hypothetical protein
MWTEAFIQSDEEEDFSTSSSAFHEAVLELLQKVGPDGATHAFDHFSITAATEGHLNYPSRRVRLNCRHCCFLKERSMVACSSMPGRSW